MPAAPIPSDEATRLASLQSYEVLHSPAETEFDDLVNIAARVCGVPIALISLVDGDQQWCKACSGQDSTEIPRAQSFCAHAILQPKGVTHVPDATKDRRFADNPLVTSTPGIRFYAGAPLVTPDGQALGTLCVLDHEPRSLTPEQQETLRVLARQVMNQLELRRALRVLGDNQESYRLLFQANPLPYWVYDRKTRRFLNVNNTAIESYGYSREEFLAMTAMDIRPLEDVPAFLEATASTLGNFRRSGIWRHRRKDGTVFPVVVFAHELTFEGRPAILVLSLDISVREAALESLRKSEQRFRTLAESAPIGIFECDLQGRSVYQNSAWSAISGRPVKETLGEGWSACVHPDDRDRITTEWQRRIGSTAQWTDQHRLVRPDGSIRWVRMLVAPQRDSDDSLNGYVGTVEDITDRITAEERFRLLAKATSDALWDWDLATDLVWWSDGIEVLFGFKPSELEPTSESWTKRIHPDDRERVVSGLDKVIAGGGELWTDEYRFLRKDGSHAIVKDRAHVIRDPKGRAVRLVGGLSDLTEQKKLETQYLRAQRMESIGTLAGGIAHDLNNVLAPILMAIELLKQQAQNEGHLKLLNTIETSTRRGADLVRQVLSFARGMEGQRIALRLEPLIKEMSKIAAETFPRSIEIETALSKELWPIIGDPTQLHQVLLNLTVNARDAMPQGGVLTLGAKNVVIDEQYARTSGLAQPGQHVMLTISDTGVGIPSELVPRIFEPFFTTKKVGEGTGLGLSTVHAIIKSHGGFVTVSSEHGKGTTFTVHLPADPSLRSVSNHPFIVNIPRGNGELILVVDDEPAIRTVTQQTLEAFGYRVLTAGDGAEAVAVYARQSSDIALVLTDMVMPVMDGPTTIAALTRINPHVRVIAASGFNAGGRVAKAVNVGVKHFLPKPYNADTLLKLIRSVLDEPSSSPLPAKS